MSFGTFFFVTTGVPLHRQVWEPLLLLCPVIRGTETSATAEWHSAGSNEDTGKYIGGAYSYLTFFTLMQQMHLGKKVLPL